MNRPLTVGYVGRHRADVFREFLCAHFGAPQVHTDSSPDAIAASGADVLVLDWPTRDGLARWRRDRTRQIPTPLGQRATHEIPTVVLGDGTLNLAIAWEIHGGFG